MGKELEKDIKKYKRQIKKQLICNTKQSRIFMSDLSASIENFVTATQPEQIAEIEKHFGKPEDIAKSFLADTDVSALRKRIGIKKAFFIAIAAIVVIYIGCILIQIIDVQIAERSRAEEEITVVESHTYYQNEIRQ